MSIVKFGSIRGHVDILSRITQEISSNQFQGAYLFEGVSGIGKYTIARTIGKYLTCTGFGDDSCRCENCRLFPNVPDYLEIGRDNESINISDIEPIDEFLSLMSFRGKSRVVIIDNAHNLNNVSSNRLLKILEEIPQKCAIILITENTRSIIEPIISRCYQINFGALNVEEVNSILENLGYKKSSIKKISQMVPFLSSSLLVNFDRYIYYINYMPKFIKELTIKREDDLIAEIKDISYKGDLEIFIDLFLVIINDILKIRYKSPNSILYSENIDFLEEMTSVWKEDLCIYMIDRVKKIHIQMNNRLNLKLDQLFLPTILWLYYFLHKDLTI